MTDDTIRLRQPAADEIRAWFRDRRGGSPTSSAKPSLSSSASCGSSIGSSAPSMATRGSGPAAHIRSG